MLGRGDGSAVYLGGSSKNSAISQGYIHNEELHHLSIYLHEFFHCHWEGNLLKDRASCSVRLTSQKGSLVGLQLVTVDFHLQKSIKEYNVAIAPINHGHFPNYGST